MTRSEAKRVLQAWAGGKQYLLPTERNNLFNLESGSCSIPPTQQERLRAVLHSRGSATPAQLDPMDVPMA